MSGKLMPPSFIGLALPTFLLLLPGSGIAQTYKFFPIDASCSDCGTVVETDAEGINAAGDVVGGFVDAEGKQHGYVLSRGKFMKFDVPGKLANVDGFLPTLVRGIDSAGDLVGDYRAPVNPDLPEDSPLYCPYKSPACIKGFLYSHGKFSTVVFPGHPGAVAQRITPDGNIYGCLHDFDTEASMFGATWKKDGATSLEAGGGELNDPTASVPFSMNNGATPDGHTVVGYWVDTESGNEHGYVVHNGIFQSYDVPSALATDIWDINAGGTFVGVYLSADGGIHSYVQLPGGSYPITADPPDAVAAVANGINPGGVIVGQYLDSNYNLHGFLAVPKDTN